MTKLDRILRELEPELQQALLNAFNDMRSGVDMRALETAIEAYDLNGVIEALNADEGSFLPYVLVATTIYMRYGQAFAPTLIKGGRFAVTASPPVIADNVGRMTEDTRQVIREIAASGLGKRETAKRVRSMIGLSRAQMSYVDSMRARLESGDPAEMVKVLGPKTKGGRYLGGMTLRDKRYDTTIKKAILDGKPVPAGKINEMTNAYARKLQADRAKRIAAAEVQQYAETAKFDAAAQAAVKAGGDVEKTWHHSSIYLNARPDHVGMSGVSVRGIETRFIMFDGTPMQYAHDPAGGVRHNANCRCRTTYRVEKV